MGNLDLRLRKRRLALAQTHGCGQWLLEFISPASWRRPTAARLQRRRRGNYHPTSGHSHHARFV